MVRGAVIDQKLCMQVIDTSQLDIKGGDDLALTSRVTTRLKHPCIVRTLAHCVTAAPSSRPWDSAGSAPSKSSNRDACWMLLEFCDKGTLQVWILENCLFSSALILFSYPDAQNPAVPEEQCLRHAAGMAQQGSMASCRC